MGVFLNIDCMEGMKQYPDKYFDLAIVDPPYGSGLGDCGGCKGWFTKYRQDTPQSGGVLGTIRGQIRQIPRTGQRGRTYSATEGNGLGGVSKSVIDWDIAPPEEYFAELWRVSKNQIIWGGNYFGLPPNRCFVIWRKTNVPHNFSMAMAEYGWTSFNGNSKVFDYSAIGQEGRFHPTQKPIALYKWLLTNYAKPGDIILDTHVGSASSLIACEELGFDYVGFEINEGYYQKAKARIEEFNQQVRMF